MVGYYYTLLEQKSKNLKFIILGTHYSVSLDYFHLLSRMFKHKI